MTEEIGPDYSLVARVYIEEQIRLVDSQAAEIIRLRQLGQSLKGEVTELRQMVGPHEEVLARLIGERDDALAEARDLKLLLRDHAWRSHKAAQILEEYR